VAKKQLFSKDEDFSRHISLPASIAHDTPTYFFPKGAFVVASKGEVDADKPVILNPDGKLDSSLLPEFELPPHSHVKADITDTPWDGEDTYLQRIGVPTYNNLQDWLNNIQSAGRISGGEITANAASDGTIDVAAGTGFIKTTNSGIGVTKSFDWALIQAIALADNSISYIYISYSAGSPIVAATTDRTTIDGRTEFTLGRVYREGTTLHILNAGTNVPELAHREHERLLSVRGFERASGGEVLEVGERYLSTSAGIFYFGLNKILTLAQNTSGADRFIYWYRDGAGGWTKVTNQQQIDNLQYDDGSGALTTLTANRYGVHWIYIHYDSDINVVYGQGDYKLADAENAVPPDTLPDLVGSFGILAAKVIVQKSAANLLTVESAYKQLFPTTFPPKLIDLTDVNAETPADDDILSWDTATSKWINAKSITTTAKARAYLSANQLDITSSTFIRIDLNAESYDPGGNFNNGLLGSGTATGTTANHLIDTGYDFAAAGIRVGMRIKNTTDTTYTYITAVAVGDLTLRDDIFVNGENWEVQAARFIAPVDGNYLIAGRCRYASVVADKVYYCTLLKNGTSYVHGITHSSSAFYVSPMVTDIIYLLADDFVEMVAYHEAGVNTVDVFWGEGNTFLSVHLLSV